MGSLRSGLNNHRCHVPHRARNVARVQKLRMEYDLAFESRVGRSVGRDLLRTPSGDGHKPFDAYDKEGENEREKDQVPLHNSATLLQAEYYPFHPHHPQIQGVANRQGPIV